MRTRILAAAATILLLAGCGGPKPEIPQQQAGNRPDTSKIKIDGDPDTPVNKLAIEAIADLQDFWSKEFGELYGEDYKPVAGGFFASTPESQTGPKCAQSYDDVAGNAFYCKLDDSVAWDAQGLLPDLKDKFGDFVIPVVLAHEWGHAIHSHLSNKGQPFATAGYAIFVAEIASTTNEGLLLDYMLKGAKDDDERMLYLGSALETLRGTYFRQTMFAEFERRVHDTVDKGQSLTGAQLTQIYGEILRRYHGDAVKIDDLYAIEWAYIPHFYSPFYVFQYATSIAAGSLFADDILASRPGARERYLKLLSAGGSDYPYELVKAAGVDLATPAPYNAIAARMNRIMDEIEVIIAKRK